MREFFHYMFGFLLGYAIGIWQTNNKWIWTAHAPNLRNFCRKRKFSVKDMGKEDTDTFVSACYKGRTK